MKNLSYFFILFFFLSIFSCSNEKDNPINGYNVDTDISIYLKDGEGNNLLDTENYLEKNMKLFYVVNNVSKEFYNGRLNTPRNLHIIKESLPYRLVIFPNDTDTEEFPITYLKWNETDTDTIKCHVRRGEGYEICDKVWFNGKVVLDVENPSDIGKGRVFDVVK